jgi:sn-glycerol 3-phosphate transport system ATP-binding protein
MATIELNNVIKRYHKQRVIHGIDLEIKKGQLAVIVGPSGCGKSTLLRMIAGLETVSSGDIKINNKIVNHLPPKKRDIAMVFQNYALYPHMSVYQNIAYALKMRGFSRDIISRKVKKVAETLQLTDYLKRKPGALSGGQRQRVAMGRAMVREPTLFLFDEPLSNLDAKLRSQMRIEIFRLQKTLGVTSIYVTHDQVEAMTLADNLIVMNEGKIEQVGKPLDIYRHPASKFVASFIGSPTMNFIEGEVCNGGSVLSFFDKYLLPLRVAKLTAVDGERICVGMRPEHLTIAEPSDRDQFRVRVDIVESLGSDTIIYGQILGSDQVLSAKFPGHIRTHQGEVLTLAVKPHLLSFFDINTHQRIEPV